MTDRTELRRLLDEYPKTVGLQNVTNAWFELARAAVSALPSLLDQLDAAEAALARVRELHRESRGSMSALYPNPICECGKDYPCPTIRALDADGHPVAITVGDLTARHIGRRVRLDEHYDAKLETVFAHEDGEVALNFTHAEGFTYGCSRTLDTPCEVLR